MTTQADIQALQRTDLDFFRALLDRDIPALETLLAEEFLIVDVASGSVNHREAFLDAINGRMVTFREIKTFPDETVIRLADPGAGIVVGRTEMSFSGADGGLTEVASRYTHVFRADGPSWRLLSAQGTPIPKTSSSR
jgi:ketosteroid isomerase-like protein